VKVPFRLNKIDRQAHVAGLLLLSENVAELLELCARLRPGGTNSRREGPALPPIHAVPGGFLIEPGRPRTGAFPNTIRLRRLADGLFVPADADLTPALLDEEASGMVRDRGLVFLPGGRVLAYDRHRPLTPADLLAVPRAPAHTWSALPAPPPRPDRLREVRLDLPEQSPEELLAEGAEGVGVEEPRPPEAGPGATLGGKAALGAGQGLVWLGNVLRWPGLAKLGASLAGRALAQVPRLAESLLGKQEAALRELLRQFREGNLEEALRRALPLGGAGGRGGRPAEDARLPLHRLRFSLADLLGGGRGPASVWFSKSNTQSELAREYRKAAEAATARGDYRRAAFIYGRLLHDYRLAADVLARGGHHHEAAILYLEKLIDTRAAALAFEAAGEVDRALELYRRRGEHVQAGDLLRRAGEIEAAVQEYLLAADELAAAGNHLGAGDLLKNADRPDLACTYFAAGWAQRPQGTALPCLLRLVEWHAEQESPRDLLALVTEADAFLGRPGNEADAGQFYNSLARLADRTNLSAVRDDLRDLALRGLAGKMRQRVPTEERPGDAVSTMLSRPGLWPAPLVSDADFAYRAALRRRPRPRRPAGPASWLHACRGPLTAVCAAAETGKVFLGSAGGEVACFDPVRGSAAVVPRAWPPGQPIAARGTDARGEVLVVLLHAHDEVRLVSCTLADGLYRPRQERQLPYSQEAWLTAVAGREGQTAVGVWDGESLRILWATDLVPTESLEWPQKAWSPDMVLLAPPDASGRVASCVALCGPLLSWCLADETGKTRLESASLGWQPHMQPRPLHAPVPLAWRTAGADYLEFAGVTAHGSVHETQVHRSGEPITLTVTTVSGGGTNYRAATLLCPGQVAAVRQTGVDWLRSDNRRLAPRAATEVELEGAVACFASPGSSELIVVCHNGSLARLRVPQA
jgi:tetratricopeptide (TPR) repeat protein